MFSLHLIFFLEDLIVEKNEGCDNSVIWRLTKKEGKIKKVILFLISETK